MLPRELREQFDDDEITDVSANTIPQRINLVREAVKYCAIGLVIGLISALTATYINSCLNGSETEQKMVK
jgi:hypothetical protein